MKELHVLVDFENVQPSMDALAKLVPGFTDVWLFYGPHQAEQAQAWAASHQRVTLVPRSGKGPNALDFHLSFHLGYMAAKHPDAELVVVANDRGYDPMLAHVRMLNFRARRVGYKGPLTRKAAVVKPAAPIVPVLAVPVAAKKAVAKKAAAKKAVAKQAAPKPATPAKAAATKKSPSAKKAPAARKTVAAKSVKPGQAAKTPKPTPATTPEAKLLTRITKALEKMGDKAPTKLKSFMNALKPMLNEHSTAADAEAMLQTLQSKGLVQVQGVVVTYPK